MKKIFKIVLCLMIMIGFTACEKKDVLQELEGVNSTINQYMAVNEYPNFLFNYVDYENKVVVVGLENASKEEQKAFKEAVVNSKLIEFKEATRPENLPGFADDTLVTIQTNITNSVSIMAYDNFASVYIDTENSKIVVELIDNSEEQQMWFKENINNSDLIVFEQGGPYTTSE